jgi:hypothetical protein
MRKLTLAATAAMFIGAQAALAAPLPPASGQQLRGDASPIVSVKHKKHRNKSSMSGGGASTGTAGGGMSSGSMPSGANMGSGGGAPTGGGGGK